MASPKLYDYNTSFSLARTNPAISGNFKITVDSSGGVWFNSFDTNPVLNDSRYKKYRVTGKKTYAEDVYNFFGQGLVSPSVIFDVYKSTDGDKEVSEDYPGQYDFFYGSGAQTLIDKNYTEDFSYFAPLWIRSEIPDFFVVFKVPGPLSYKYSENQENIVDGIAYKVIKKYGQEDFVISYGVNDQGAPVYYSDGDFFTGLSTSATYSIISGEGSVCIFNENENIGKVNDVENYFTEKILPNCQVIKTFDLRDGTQIGDYIRGIFSSIGPSFSPISVTFGNESYSYFNGISVSSGTYTSAGEFLSTFFTSTESTPMIDMERYITEGFSRNGILCPNLLNLEFLFDDPYADDYSINRYFGAYVSRNDLGNFRLNGNFLYQFRNSKGNENFPKPKRNSFGYYTDNANFPQSATGGVRIYYEGASGFIPGSNDVNNSGNLKLFYITDKNDNFYSLKRVENLSSILAGGSSPYSYGPYSYASESFGPTGSTGATSGTLVLQNSYLDLINFTGVDDKLASVKGIINGENGRPYVDVQFLKKWDIPTKKLVFKIYWPLGSRLEGAERYDLIKSDDFSGTIVWVPGSTYHSGNNYFFNSTNGTPEEIASSFSTSIYDISKFIWDSGTSSSTSIIRVKSPRESGNLSYYISVFDDYDYFDSKYQKNWSSVSAYLSGDIVKYGESYYRALVNIPASSSPPNLSPDELSNTSWEKYYTLSHPGYVKIKGVDASQISGVSFFQGGTDKPRTRVIFGSDLTNIVSEFNFIQTENGFSKIKEVGRYVDSPIYDDMDKELVTGFNDYTVYSVAVISDEYETISLGSDSRFNVYSSPILKTGVFTFFDYKDFDFDFWSSNYGITPNYETYRYFQILPDTENMIHDGVEYFVKQGSISYNGSVYGQFSTFLGSSSETYFTSSGQSSAEPVVFPLQFSDANYGTYNSNVGYEINLNEFDGFIGIRSVEIQGDPPQTATKKQSFDFGLLDIEYDYLEENYTIERSSLSRIVPYILKWSYKDGSDSRGNPYRLNVSPAFSPSNFSPTFNNIGSSPNYLTHEWFLLEKVPRDFPTLFMKDQQSYVGSSINLSLAQDASPENSLYAPYYFTSTPSDYPVDVRDDKDLVKELFSEFSFNIATGFYEAVFKGAKIILKKKSDFKPTEGQNEIDPYIRDFRGYEGYRYSCLLRVLTEDDETIQAPVKYKFIENNTQKFVIFLIDVVLNDYKLQPLGYTGGTGGDPILDYTLLYSLSNKNKLIETPVAGQPLYSIGDIKLSSALNLSGGSDSLVNGSTDPGFIYILPNPDYDTDLREEINLFYTTVASQTIGYTGPGSFSVPSISCLYPWPVGSAEGLVEFAPVGSSSNYYFTIPFSTASPVTVPVGPISIYRDKPVFQIQGGQKYFDFIIKRTSFSYVSERVNFENPYISYVSYFYDESTGSTYSKESDFQISFEEPTLVVKPAESYPVPIYSLPNQNASSAEAFGQRTSYQVGPIGTAPNQVISYTIGSNLGGVPSQLLRYSGKYEPIFRKVWFFKNDKTDTIPGTGVDLSFRNCTFSPESYYFGVIRNLSFTKVSSTNILSNSQNLLQGASYPLIGQTPISRKDFNVFQSSWDSGYYDKFTSATSRVSVAGTRSMVERKSFMGSKMMKTPKNVVIDNYITMLVSSNSGITDVSYINSEALNSIVSVQTITAANSGQGIGMLTAYNTSVPLNALSKNIFPNVELFWQKPSDDTIIGTIRLDRMLRRYLMNSGAGNVFFDNIISEFGVGDPASIQDDVIRYIVQNVNPIYEGSILQLYVKKTASEDTEYEDMTRGDIASTERLRLGYYPEKNVTYTKESNLVYNFTFSIDPNFDYSLIFRFNIDKI
jgi:hypothetical protein